MASMWLAGHDHPLVWRRLVLRLRLGLFVEQCGVVARQTTPTMLSLVAMVALAPVLSHARTRTSPPSQWMWLPAVGRLCPFSSRWCGCWRCRGLALHLHSSSLALGGWSWWVAWFVNNQVKDVIY